MTFFCIGDTASVLGFKFTGIETREVSGPVDTREALKVALATAGVGVIIITEKAASFIRSEIDELIYQHRLPLILEIPSRGEARPRESAGEFLKRAIGISV